MSIDSFTHFGYGDGMKAQASMIEHLFVVLFIIVIIVLLMLFLTNFQFSQMEMEKKKAEAERSLSTAKMFLNSQFTTKKESVAEDAKLSSLISFSCHDLETIFGQNWFLEVRVLDEGDIIIPCTSANEFSHCNYWSLSSCSSTARNISYVLPVNVYRKMFERTDIGLIKAGVYI